MDTRRLMGVAVLLHPLVAASYTPAASTGLRQAPKQGCSTFLSLSESDCYTPLATLPAAGVSAG